MSKKLKIAIIILVVIFTARGQIPAPENVPGTFPPKPYSIPAIGGTVKQCSDTGNQANSTATPEQILNFSEEMSQYVLIFGLILALFSGLIAFKTKGWNREATNVFTVTIIITAGLFLMTAGYSSQQIAPMYGLLGTIVGYLLGKTRPPEEQEGKPGEKAA